MLLTQESKNAIVVPDAPRVPGLTFRRYGGQDDVRVIADVAERSNKADGIDFVLCAEELARLYESPVNWDPYRDVLLVEMHGQVIGASRVWWETEADGTRTYNQRLCLLPVWRGKGIRRAMLHHNERRLSEVAAGHPDDVKKVFLVGADEANKNWEALLVREGYTAVRYFLPMVRADLEEIPELPVPAGLQVRPARREQYQAIWEAAREAFLDHWGGLEGINEWFQSWPESPSFDLDLWQVAWDGDQVAGMVLNVIDHAQNRMFDRKRGIVSCVCVRRPWRRQGLARALMARSLRLLRDQGMSEAALFVDAQNPQGALPLYESVGFCSVGRVTFFKKPLNQGT